MILVGLLVIASVGMGALYLRQLDQQRQIKTQQQLEVAFQGLFPGHQQPSANMWKDFRFTPDFPTPPGGYDLRCMIDRTQVGAVDVSMNGVPAFTGTPTAGAGDSLGAWNGPYWQGSVDAQGHPVDAWGRPIRLRHISTTAPPGWQVFSPGANGTSETGDVEIPANDDLVYPQPPYVIPPSTPPVSLCASPTIPFQRTSGYNPAENISITLSWSWGGVTVVAKFNGGHPEGNPPPVFSDIPQGVPITVTLTSDRRPSLPTATITLDTSCTLASPITF